jgi:hypothetical protein
MKKIQTILTIAALCGAMLAGVTACQNPLYPARPAQAAEQGYGKVTVSLGTIESAVDTGAARTVYPGTGGLTCVYTFTKTGGQPQTLTPTDGNFTLEYGEWTVEVKAYAGTATEGNLAASGTKTFTVNAASQTVAVELAGVTATGAGTFSYRIQYPQGARVSGFTMKKLPALTTSVTLNYGAGTTSGEVTTITETKTSISAGLYFVTLRLEQQGRYAGRSEVVHIYDKLTSEWGTASAPLVFTANDFAAVPLSEGVWADGSLSSDGEQWFSFTATAATQYIHVSFGTLNSSQGVYVQLYDSAGTAAGSQSRLYGSTLSLSQTLTIGQTYTIKVTPYSNSDTGTYQIAFNASSDIPVVFNTWANGSLSSGGEQRFSFTATAATQYIHVRNFSTTSFAVYGVYVQLYDSTDAAVGSQSWLYGSTLSLSQTLIIGQAYTIQVTPYNSSYTGTYQIAFNASFAPPGATALTADTWVNGSLPNTNTQNWYSFTATAATQYIHVRNFSTTNFASSGVNVQVYDSDGTAVGSQSRLNGSTLSLSRALTSGQMYTIKVTPYSDTGTYQIAFTASLVPPDTTALTANTWANGNLSATNRQNWYRFTATADRHYIHVNFTGSLPGSIGVYVQMYDSAGTGVSVRTNLSATNTKTFLTGTIGQTYYIQVTPYYSDNIGTYRIAFNASSTAPQ